MLYIYSISAVILNISNISQEPMHAQISRQIRAKILSGSLKEDDHLPSIREFAANLKVSVITVQKAYEDLMQEGLIHSRYGKGFFVNKLTSEMRSQLAQKKFEESISPIVRDAIASGLSKDEIIKIIKSTLKAEDK